jgi:hypothetical protein
MDPELEAMTAVAKAIEKLDPDAKRRVMSWVSERYDIPVKKPMAKAREQDSNEGGGDVDVAALSSFDELFDAADPQTSADKALVAAYWFQVHENNEEFDAATLNIELKNLGHQSKNITRDFDALIAKSPRYAMQVKKSGSTRQARKKYKLTREGIRAVERMLKTQGAEE